VDWSLLWHRELAVRGTVYYGTEDVTDRASLRAGRRRAMQVALEVLEGSDVVGLVTHVFPLHEATAALATAAAGPGAGAVKVAFRPSEAA
jgi:threonine dehydrogenase-like Zn-dependent dehydrogenase